jgi:ribosomal protein S18 acetylase RimI-like enzyme
MAEAPRTISASVIDANAPFHTPEANRDPEEAFHTPDANRDAGEESFHTPEASQSLDQALQFIDNAEPADIGRQAIPLFLQYKDRLSPDQQEKLAVAHAVANQKGLTAEGVVEGVKGGAHGVGQLARGVWEFAKRAPGNAMALNPGNVAYHVATGKGLTADEKKRAAETVAAVETAATGFGGLARGLVRNVVNKSWEKKLARTLGVSEKTISKFSGPEIQADILDLVGPNPGSFFQPMDIKQRFYDDAAMAEQMTKTTEGTGEVLKSLGISSDELAKLGVTWDKDAVAALSTVYDPVNLVLMLRGLTIARAAKGYQVKNASGKVLAGFVDRKSAEAFVKRISEKTQSAGKLLEKGAKKFPLHSASMAGAVTGLATGGSVPAAVATGAGIKYGGQLAGKAITYFGESLKPGVVLPALEYGAQAGKGALHGGAFMAPFALGADTTEDAISGITVGAALGGGLGVGGTAFGQAKAKAIDVQAKLLARRFRTAPDIRPAGRRPTYGTDAELDAGHEALMDSLQKGKEGDPATFNLIQRIRGLLDASSTKEIKNEFYALAPDVYDKYVGAAEAESRGKFYTEARTGADGRQINRVLVRLGGKDLSAAFHEPGHALVAIAPEEVRSELRADIESVYGKHFDALWETYKSTAPDWLVKKLEADPQALREYIANEVMAETFASLLRGVRLDGLPVEWREKVTAVASRFGEILGLSEGRFDPGAPGATELGLTPSPKAARTADAFIQEIRAKMPRELAADQPPILPPPIPGEARATPPPIPAEAKKPLWGPEQDKILADVTKNYPGVAKSLQNLKDKVLKGETLTKLDRQRLQELGVEVPQILAEGAEIAAASPSKPLDIPIQPLRSVESTKWTPEHDAVIDFVRRSGNEDVVKLLEDLKSKTEKGESLNADELALLEELADVSEQMRLRREEAPRVFEADDAAPEQKPAEQLELPVNQEGTPVKTTPKAESPVETTKPDVGIPVSAAETPAPPSIRNTPENVAKFSGQARKPAEGRVAAALEASKNDPNLTPEQKAAVESLLTNIRTPHDVVYNAAKVEGGTGRTARRADIEAARGNPELREVASKLASIPLDARESKSGTQIQFWSGDKVVANIDTAVKAISKAGQEKEIPYPVKNGRLTDEGAAALAEDLRKYGENQDNGYRGDGQKLNRPENPDGFIPDENPDYTPQPLSSPKALEFLNLLMGERPPKTATIRRNSLGEQIVPIQARAKKLAAANQKEGIPIQPAKKYKEPFQDVTISEYNPLRDRLQKAGVDLSQLTEAHEWVNAKEIQSAKLRSDIKLSPTATDVTAAGFLPAKKQNVEIEGPDGKKYKVTFDGEWDMTAFGKGKIQAFTALEDLPGSVIKGSSTVGPSLEAAGFKLPKLDAPAPDFQFLPSKNPRAVKQAAVQDKDGNLYTGAFHAEAAEKYWAAKGDPDASLQAWNKSDELVEGFVTNEGEFLTREQAFERAQELGQYKPKSDDDGQLESGRFNKQQDQRVQSYVAKTEAGRKLEDAGLKLSETTDPATRRSFLEIRNSNHDSLSELSYFVDENGEAFVSSITTARAHRRKGYAEALYREMLARLQEQGVDTLKGTVVSAGPVRIRKKLLGNVDLDSVFGEGPVKNATSKIPEGAQFLPEKSPVWYSELERTVADKMPNAATPEQLRATLRGVKADELKWSGLDDFLTGKQKVTKAEVQQFLEQNRLELKEVVKGGDRPPLSRGLQEYLSLNHNGDAPGTPEGWSNLASRLEGSAKQWQRNGDPEKADRFFAMSEEATARAEGLNESGSTAGEPKFERYQLPGGENYREILFTLPGRVSFNADGLPSHVKIAEGKLPDSRSVWRVYEVGADGKPITGRPVLSASTVSREAAIQDAQLDPRWLKDPKSHFISSHWDEPNVLAHTRVNDRNDSAGKPGLFIEEIQSDWHQKGRKEGYAGDAQAELEAARVAYQEAKKTPLPDAEPETYVKWSETFQAAEKRVNAAAKRVREVSEVPDAPYRNTWQEMVFRRLVRQAAEEGKEWIGWTTGEMQAERYDLSKQVKALFYRKTGAGYEVVAQPLDGGVTNLGEAIPESKLADYVGKEVAEKIVAGEGSAVRDNPQWKKSLWRDYTLLEGEGLKVGGAGMKGFYDKILVDYANKFGRKFGAKVESRRVMSEHGGGAPKSVSVHALPVTPEMRKSVLEQGVPQFMGANRGKRPTPPKLEEFRDGKQIENALKKPGWAIITATKEVIGNGLHPENVARNRELAAQLAKSGKDFARVQGFYEGVDQGDNFLVLDVTPAEAMEMARLLDQDSVLIPDGLLYKDGTLTPVNADNNIVGDVAKTQDYYSQLDDGPAFTLGLELEKRVPYGDLQSQMLPARQEELPGVRRQRLETAIQEREQSAGRGAEAYRRYPHGEQARELEARYDNGYADELQRALDNPRTPEELREAREWNERERNRLLNRYEQYPANRFGDLAQARSHDGAIQAIDRLLQGDGAQFMGHRDDMVRITKAAVRDPESERVFTGKTHKEAIREAIRAGHGIRAVEQDFDFGFQTSEGNFVDRRKAFLLANGAKQFNRRSDNNTGVREDFTGKDVLLSEHISQSLDEPQFMGRRKAAKKPAKTAGNRDEFGRPLLENGRVDIDKWESEVGAAEVEKYFEDPAAWRAAHGEKQAPAESPTAWILPDGKVEPVVDTGLGGHSDKLNENAQKYNERFGTEFKTDGTLDDSDRITALKSGFMRVRYVLNGGRLTFEGLAGRWDGQKSVALNHALEHLKKVDNLAVHLFDNNENLVASHELRVFSIRGTEAKEQAIRDLFQSIRPPTVSRPRGEPTMIQRARALGDPEPTGLESQYLPRSNKELANLTPAERKEFRYLSQNVDVIAPWDRDRLRNLVIKVRDNRTVRPKKFSGAAPDTEAFQKWFGESKIVDRNGEPLVVYHGSRADFTAFSKEKRGVATGADSAKEAFFFSKSPYTAETYIGIMSKAEQKRHDTLVAEGKSKEAVTLRTSGGNVMPVYLKIENPFVYDFGKKGFEDGAFTAAIAKAKEGGHDGVIFKNAQDTLRIDLGPLDDIYAVFEPEQIKSATGNRGTFDPSDPDIRFLPREGGPLAGLGDLDIRSAGRRKEATVTTARDNEETAVVE